MTVKLLAQASAEILLAKPEQAETILQSIRSLIRIKYPKIKWPVFIETVINLITKHNHIDRIKIISAETLSPEQLRTIAERLSIQNPDITTDVDPSILAGIVIKSSDKILDLSAKGRLDALAQAVTKE